MTYVFECLMAIYILRTRIIKSEKVVFYSNHVLTLELALPDTISVEWDRVKIAIRQNGLILRNRADSIRDTHTPRLFSLIVRFLESMQITRCDIG